jgi:hypothetical protein
VLRLRSRPLGIKAPLRARVARIQQPRARTVPLGSSCDRDVGRLLPRGRWRFRIANASRPANRVRSHWAWIAVRQPRHGASANSARTTATATQRITRFRSGKPLSLFVFGSGLRFALRLFSTCNPRRSNLHQYRFVLFRYSLRQTPAFCRVLPEEVSVTVHDTFHLFGCSNVRVANREL